QAANSGSLRYFDFDNMVLNLGSEAETVHIVGLFESYVTDQDDSNADTKQGSAVQTTHRQLTINAGDGNDVINIGVGTYNNGASGADGISQTDIANLPTVDALSETTAMDRIHGDITLNSGDGDDTVHLDDSTDTKINTAYMTSTMVAGLSRIENTGDANHDTDNDVAFVYDTTLENLNLYMGINNDRLFIEETFANTTHIVGNGGSDSIIAKTLNGTVIFEGDSTDQNVAAMQAAVTGINSAVTEEADHIFIDTIAASAVVTISTDRGDDIVDIKTMGDNSVVIISGEEGDDGIRVENVGLDATLTVHGDNRDATNPETTYSDKDIIFVDSNNGTVNLNGDGDNDRIYLRANTAVATANVDAGTSTSTVDDDADTSEVTDLTNLDDLATITDLDFVKIGAEAPNQWQDFLVELENAHIDDGAFNGVLGSGTDGHAYNDGGATWITGVNNINGLWNTASWTDIDGDGVFGAAGNTHNVVEVQHVENVGNLDDIHGTINIDGVDQDNRNYLELNDSGTSATRQYVIEDDRVSLVHSVTVDDSDRAVINYINIDDFNLFMSSGDDRVDIASTHDETDYFILGDAGDDLFNLGSITDLILDENYDDSILDHIEGYLNIQGNAGYNRDFITQPENFNLSIPESRVSIAAQPAGGISKNTWTSGGYDSIVLTDSGAVDTTNEGRISNTQIDGFGIEREDTDKFSDGSVVEASDKGGLRYFDFDNITLNLGDQVDILHIVGLFDSYVTDQDDSNADTKQGSATQTTHRQLTINAGDEDDVINIGVGTYNNGASGTDGISQTDIANLPTVDAVSETTGMDRVHGDITLNSGDGDDTVHLDDSTDIKINTAYMTATMVAGLSRIENTGDSDHDTDNDVAFVYDTTLENLNLYMGINNDRLFIEETFANMTHIVGNGGSDSILAKTLNGTVIFEGDSTDQNVAAMQAAVTGINSAVTEGDDHIFIQTVAANAIITISTDRGDDIVDITLIEAGTGSVTISGEEGDDSIRIETSDSTLTVNGDNKDSNNEGPAYSDMDMIFVDTANALTTLNGDGDADRIYLRATGASGDVRIDLGQSLLATDDIDFVKIGGEAPNQWQDHLLRLKNAHINDGSFNGTLGNGVDHFAYNEVATVFWTATALELEGSWNTGTWQDVDGDASASLAAEAEHVENVGNLDYHHGAI
ncbi:MAG: hypothetical protein MJH11_16835, partial [Lentisphaeria bacterium]|nr:hypothetical protein [Lentisphaeria bacterium]